MLSPIYKVSFGVLLKCSKANLTPSGEGFAALTSSPPTTISRKSSGWYSSRKLSILNRYLVEIIPIRALRFFSSFSVDNVDETFAALKAKGVTFISEPTDMPDWGMRTLYLRDPEENLIELFTPLAPEKFSQELIEEDQKFH